MSKSGIGINHKPAVKPMYRTNFDSDLTREKLLISKLCPCLCLVTI